MLKRKLSTRSMIALGILASSALIAPAVLAVQIYGTQDTGDKVLIRYHRSDWVKIQPKQSGTLAWNCPSNAYTVGGGFETRAEQGNSSSGFSMIHSFPSSEHQWTVRFRNTDDIARDVRVYNICAD
ncbi:hypothetical protein [Myxacorys almedinensis]|uniref:Secreted protein n=1 Tax=Myxacorys almedinensis A TaxID=2690445 RepID=A0A8J7Z347_9CYAN|nr:hypothetical protein [Myxacorys almedinensis]NDJ16961.1 hypothetical protein [Myxacorys almedinensis A]